MAQFISCSKRVEVVDGENKVSLPAGYIGKVPEWVEGHWYYKALCNDGTITAVVRTQEKTAEELAAEKAARKAAAEKAANDKRLIDEAKAAAKVKAETEAAEKGLNATDTKKLIAKMVGEAAYEMAKKLAEAGGDSGLETDTP